MDLSRRSLLVTPALGLSLLSLFGSPQDPEHQIPTAQELPPEIPDMPGPFIHPQRLRPRLPRRARRRSVVPQSARTTRMTSAVGSRPDVKISGTLRQRMIQTAISFIGIPYEYGWESLKGMDCSGLTQMVYRNVGLIIPRVADAQMRFCRAVTSPLPGDLVFFTTSGGYAYHVGLFLTRGTMIDAPHSGTVVQRQSIWSGNAIFGRHPALGQ